MKKAQVTIFIIIGVILIAFAAFLVFFLSSAEVESNVDMEIYSEEINNIVLDCIEKVVDENLQNAGVVEMNDYLDANLRDCTDFSKIEGVEITKGEVGSNVYRDDDFLFVEINYPVTVESEGESSTTSEFYLEYPLVAHINVGDNVLSGEVVRSVTGNLIRIEPTDSSAGINIPDDITVNFPDNRKEISIEIKDRVLFQSSTPESVWENYGILGRIVYDFFPDETTFSQPINIVLKYKEELVPDYIKEEDLKILSYENNEWVVLESDVDTNLNEISAKVDHFSIKGVGYVKCGGLDEAGCEERNPHCNWVENVCKPSCGMWLFSKDYSDIGTGCQTTPCQGRGEQGVSWDCQYCCESGVRKITSSMNTDEQIRQFVTRFYQQCLEREPDLAGLNGWTNQLKTCSLTGREVAENFIFSQEFIDKQTTNEKFVTILYRAFFNRNPDTEGYIGWVNKLYGGSTRKEVLDGFVGSREFNELCNKYNIWCDRDKPNPCGGTPTPPVEDTPTPDVPQTPVNDKSKGVLVQIKQGCVSKVDPMIPYCSKELQEGKGCNNPQEIIYCKASVVPSSERCWPRYIGRTYLRTLICTDRVWKVTEEKCKGKTVFTKSCDKISEGDIKGLRNLLGETCAKIWGEGKDKYCQEKNEGCFLTRSSGTRRGRQGVIEKTIECKPK